MLTKLAERWFRFYYTTDGGLLNTISVRNMLILVAAVLVAHA